MMLLGLFSIDLPCPPGVQLLLWLKSQNACQVSCEERLRHDKTMTCVWHPLREPEKRKDVQL
jgi:hypothetical protein